MKIGIDIGGSKMLLFAQSSTTEQHWRVSYRTGSEFLPATAELYIAQFLAQRPEPVSLLGIAVPGLVDPNGRVIASDVLPHFVGWHPAQDQPYPVRVLNDAAAALRGVAIEIAPDTHGVVIMVGTGIGAGFLVDGKPLEGSRGWAGELGSIPIAPGQTLDQAASGAAILKNLGINAEELVILLEQKNVHALQVIQEAGTALGLGIATIINLFNPQRVVLAGGTLKWPGYWQAALASAELYSLPDLWAACAIQQSIYGGDLVAIGAIAPDINAPPATPLQSHPLTYSQVPIPSREPSVKMDS